MNKQSLMWPTLMWLASALAFGVALCGCGDVESVAGAAISVKTDFSIETADAMVQETLVTLGADQALLQGWTIILTDDGCGGDGCTQMALKTMRIDATQSDGAVAETLCHEIVHVFLGASTGDSDPGHLRQDLFHWKTGKCGAVSRAFGG